MLRILGRLTSINVRKVAWAADELGLPFEREDWGLPLRDPKVPEFLALNPNAQVPVLVEDDFVLWESTAIMRYLAQKSPGLLLPADAREQGRVDQWLTWQVAELNPQWSYAVMALLRRNPDYGDQARISESIRNWTAKMAILDGQLARTGAFVTGAKFTLADIALALSTHRWLSSPFEKPELPNVQRHYETARARAAGGAYLTAATP